MPNPRKIDLQYLKGVGPKRAELLRKELGVATFHDLMTYYPFRYIDRSTIHHVTDINDDMPYIQLRGRFVSFGTNGEGAKLRLNALFADETGTIEMVWFNRARQVARQLHTGREYIVFGKPTEYRGHYNIVHPEVEEYSPQSQAPSQGHGLVGVYSLTERLITAHVTQRVIQRMIATLMDTEAARSLPNIMPASLMASRRLLPRAQAVRAMHMPRDVAELQQAQFTMKYEELFLLELNILRYMSNRGRKVGGHIFSRVGEHFNTFYREVLPYDLTGAQKRVLREMRADMGSGRQMNRLLQGDVGSGKTVVAFMTALLAVDNGYQACVMAPTEILANQHLETMIPWAERLGLSVALLTGSTRQSERTAIHGRLMDGTLNILVGTHALIEDNVQWARLGLAVIDEQHRFGVAQRAKLWEKAAVPPHVLVMTATPIPRTLAMTVYGDLDVSVIDELPPGRKPVTTVTRTDDQRERVNRFIGSQLREGHQVYIVYPLIEENEKLDLLAVEKGYEMVCDTFPSYRVAMVHGRMKPAEKDHQMELFASGKAHILVATTVIEVGVNVPNASVMVIENAERFGLSQLHQLRGRVGRGADRSYCVLMTRHDLKGSTRHRLDVMTQTTDGFLIAEEDLKLRGPGDLEGTMQSGMALNLKVAKLAQDGQIVQLARDDAERWLNNDPNLTSTEGRRLDHELQLIFNKTHDWSQIS